MSGDRDPFGQILAFERNQLTYNQRQDIQLSGLYDLQTMTHQSCAAIIDLVREQKNAFAGLQLNIDILNTNMNGFGSTLQSLQQSVQRLVDNGNENNPVPQPTGEVEEPAIDHNVVIETGKCGGSKNCTGQFTYSVKYIQIGGRLRCVCPICHHDYVSRSIRTHIRTKCHPQNECNHCKRRPQRK